MIQLVVKVVDKHPSFMNIISKIRSIIHNIRVSSVAKQKLIEKCANTVITDCPTRIWMEPGVLHSIAVIAHVGTGIGRNKFKKVKVFNVFVLFLHDNGMIWTTCKLQRTFVDNGTGRDKTNNNAITWSVRGRGTSALHHVCFTWISMVFVYTGVFSEYNIIIHYNSVKNTRYEFLKTSVSTICWWWFADVPAWSDVADVRCVHRPNCN